MDARTQPLNELLKSLVEASLHLHSLHTIPEMASFIVEQAGEWSGAERVLLIFEQNGKREISSSFISTSSKRKPVPDA